MSEHDERLLSAFRAAQGLAELGGRLTEAMLDPRDAATFLLKEGRLPRLGDPTPPWRYRGWLRLLVQLLHRLAFSQTAFPDRWGYLEEVLQHRRLPAAPIPQVAFSAAHPATLKTTDGWVAVLDRAHGRWDSFRAFCRFLGWGLGVEKEDPGLPDEASEALYRQVDLGQWLRHPSDYLGEVAQQRFGGGPHAFFATPQELCALIAAQTFGPGDHRAKSCLEPAMGTGRLLLAASNYCLRLAGQDIDEVMVLCTKINLATYAPWGLVRLDFLEGQCPAAERPEDMAAVRARHPGIY